MCLYVVCHDSCVSIRPLLFQLLYCVTWLVCIYWASSVAAAALPWLLVCTSGVTWLLMSTFTDVYHSHGPLRVYVYEWVMSYTRCTCIYGVRCIYRYIHMYLHVYIHAHVSILLCVTWLILYLLCEIHIYIHIHACKYIHTYTCMYTYAYIFMDIYIYTYIHMYLCIDTHIHTYTCMYLYVHIYIHTHVSTYRYIYT